MPPRRMPLRFGRRTKEVSADRPRFQSSQRSPNALKRATFDLRDFETVATSKNLW